MPRLRVANFLGVAPKISARLLGNDQGQTAKDAKLWSGALRPIGGLANGAALTKSGNIQSFYRFNGNTVWLHWTQDVNVARGPIAGDALEKTYFSGTDDPRVTSNDIYNGGTTGTFRPPDSYILGIPAPVGPPVASDAGAGNITSDCTWVYTFVRKWSDGTVDEGPPSPASNSLSLAGKQASVTLPNGAITTTDYGITHKRLYRSVGGTYKYVSEVAIGTSPTTDNIATSSLGASIETTNYLPPPNLMLGLIALPNGVMAGFKGNVVYLSEPYRPWAWPLQNQYAIAWPIVAIGNVGTTIIVATTAYPEIGRGVDPAAYSFRRHPGRFPCSSKRSLASSELGVIWSTPNGLAISDGVTVTLATKDFLTRKEWQEQFYPTTIHGWVYDSRYYGWFDNGTTDGSGNKVGGGFILDMAERAFLSTLGSYVYSSYSIPDTDQLWVGKKNPSDANKTYVYQWDGDPTNPFSYVWRSKKFGGFGLENFAFAQIQGEFGAGLTAAEIAALAAAIAAVQAFNAALASTDGAINEAAMNETPLGGDSMTQQIPSAAYTAGSVTFTYYADDDLVLIRNVLTKEPFPLPAGAQDETFEFELSGTVEVASVTMASTIEELAR